MPVCSDTVLAKLLLIIRLAADRPIWASLILMCWYLGGFGRLLLGCVRPCAPHPLSPRSGRCGCKSGPKPKLTPHVPSASSLVMQIRKLCSNRSTEAASEALADFLSEEGGTGPGILEVRAMPVGL